MKTVVLLLLAMGLGAVRAEPVLIGLEELSGGYDWGYVPPNDAPALRVATFVIPPHVHSFETLRLTMTGTSSPGEVIRERQIGGQTVADTLTAIPSMRLSLRADPLGDDCFFGIIDPTGPSFTELSGSVGACDPTDPPDLALLLNTTVRAELACVPSPDGGPYVDGLVALSDVALVLGDPVVSNGSSSWSGIKALYR